MVLPILTVPHPLLSQKSRPVRDDEYGPELLQRMKDMAETMFAAPGVGLAGVQVGDLRRILVADVGDDEDEDGYREKGKDIVFVCNPEVVRYSEEKITWEEGCLSVPEFWEDFVRPRRVTIRYKTPLGEEQERTFEDYPSIIVQHEMDHLDGTILLDRVSRLKKKRYLQKVKKWAKRAQEAAEAEAAW